MHYMLISEKGAGANTAIADACDLATLIAQEIEKNNATGPNMVALLDNYHALMCPRGREAVLSSRAAGKDEGSIMIATTRRGANASSIGAAA